MVHYTLHPDGTGVAIWGCHFGCHFDEEKHERGYIFYLFIFYLKIANEADIKNIKIMVNKKNKYV